MNEFPRNRSAKSGRGNYCKPCHNARTKRYRERRHGSMRNFWLKRRYGLDESEFDALIVAQAGRCAICGGEGPEHVDHDHGSGAVRGILCFNCNGGLGRFGDDVDRLRSAAEYLRRSGTGDLESGGRNR